MAENEKDLSKYIPKEKWDAMTEEEVAFMSKLGFQRDNRIQTDRRKARNPITEQLAAMGKSTAPDPYLLTLNIVCSCCKGSEIVKGAMILPYERAPYLKFTTKDEIISSLPLKAKKEFKRQERLICPKCTDNLNELTKEELISIIIQRANRQAAQNVLSVGITDEQCGERGEY